MQGNYSLEDVSNRYDSRKKMLVNKLNKVSKLDKIALQINTHKNESLLGRTVTNKAQCNG